MTHRRPLEPLTLLPRPLGRRHFTGTSPSLTLRDVAAPPSRTMSLRTPFDPFTFTHRKKNSSLGHSVSHPCNRLSPPCLQFGTSLMLAFLRVVSTWPSLPLLDSLLSPTHSCLPSPSLWPPFD